MHLTPWVGTSAEIHGFLTHPRLVYLKCSGQELNFELNQVIIERIYAQLYPFFTEADQSCSNRTSWEIPELNGGF